MPSPIRQEEVSAARSAQIEEKAARDQWEYAEAQRRIRANLKTNDEVRELVIWNVANANALQRFLGVTTGLVQGIPIRGVWASWLYLPFMLGRDNLVDEALREYWDQLVTWGYEPVIFTNDVYWYCLGVKQPKF